MQALDANNAFALAFNQVYATADFGLSWCNISPISVSVGDMNFVTSKLGWAAAGQIILKTQDVGRTWTQSPAPATQAWFVSVSFANTQLGLVGTSDGRLFETTNGTTWVAMKNPLYGVCGGHLVLWQPNRDFPRTFAANQAGAQNAGNHYQNIFEIIRYRMM